MPFPLIPAALGACFLLVWVFIGGMIFRDSQLAAQSERDSDVNILPLLLQRPNRQRRSNSQKLPAGRQPMVRVAS